MNKILQYISSSLSRRLRLFIALLATSVFVVALAVMFMQSREAVRSEALEHATQQLSNTVQRIDNILERVEVATNDTKWLVNRHPDCPDSMFVYSKSILENNPDLHGCSIAFEPYYFKEYGRYFSAFAYWNNGKVEVSREGSPSYEYFYMDWYQLSKLLDKPAWTEPFIDSDSEEDVSGDMIFSYCQPIWDNQGNYIGTIATDLALEWLSETISAVKPYPNSYSVMIGRGGTFLVHPDPSKLIYESIFTDCLEGKNPEKMALGQAMVHGEEGVKQLKINNELCYIFYKPLEKTGWSVAIVCPENDIFKGFNRLRNTVIGIFVIGLLLMLYVLAKLIQRELKPLNTLTDQAESIAAGNFDEELPNDGRTDEVGRLCQSFGNMQQSLVRYIEEMKSTTAAKAAIENEIKVASDIQMSMVPRIFPPFPNRHDIDLFASMTPAKEVGGDLYDFFVENEKLYFCIGDVSGKGIPASLFMAVTRNLFRIIAQQEYSPQEIATKINHALSADNDQGMFVTMFIGKVDLQTGRMEICNCGHNPPVICEPGGVPHFLQIKNTNIPLGTCDDFVFQGEVLENTGNTQLLLYTDGLTEAENLRYDLFGEDRLLKAMEKAPGMDSQDVVVMLQEAVEAHRAGVAPNDDLTILCLKLVKDKN